MLQALIEYAQQEGLLVQRGYTPKDVRWAVDMTADGKFLGLIELGNPEQKRNPGIRFIRSPDLAQNEMIAGGITRSHFLIDTLSVIIPWGPEEALAKNSVKHEYFVQLLLEASEALPTLHSALRFFKDPQQLALLLDAAQQKKAGATDKATVRIDGQFPVEDPRWYPWWDTFRGSLTGPNDSSGVCLVTGKTGPVTQTHPKVSGLSSVGGASTGSVLVSFDKPAFTSYGLAQGANAPMTEEAAVGYTQALGHLIADAPKFGEVKVLHWFSQRLPDYEDPFAFLEMPEERAKQEAHDEGVRTLSALRLGAAPTVHSKNKFYAVLISAVSARIMIRGWYEGTYDALQRYIAQWFEDISIVRTDGLLAKTPPFWRVLADLTPEKRDLPSPFVKTLWESAVFLRPIPHQAVQLALVHIRQSIRSSSVMPIYAYGILKAFLIRQQGGRNMTQTLDEERPEVAYHAGRLLAVMGQLQNAANPGVNSDVVTRFYNAASTNPALTFGRLNSLSRYHLNKLDKDGLRFWFEGELAQVMARIRDFPTTLSLSEQSLFALGYYHQLAYYRSRHQQNKERTEINNDNATESL